ncbi:MAG: hypothetical protein MUC29_13210 [Pyrinomonadaceae bacterium]|nr:hypothetical protein [Pyrinomonadaceae bacterium]
MKKLTYSILISLFIFNLTAFAQVLEIGNFSLKAKDGAEIISLKKNGEVVVNQQVIGKLSSDGKLTDTSGKTMATITDLGLVTDSDKINYGLIYKNGILDNGSRRQIGWTKDGKFELSDKDLLTISPNKKKFYQTASFLIMLNFFVKQTFTPPTEAEQIEQNKLNYKDSDIVLSIETGMCNGRCESLLTIFGNGNLAYTSGFDKPGILTVVGKTTRAKINKLLQRAANINFPNLPDAPARPHVHDGASVTTKVWFNGKLIKIGCGAGEGCPKEALKFSEFITELFAEDLAKLNRR